MSLTELFRGPAATAWRYFDTICSIPRPSKHEEAIRSWLLRQGKEHGWTCRQDAVGNVVLVVPGTGRGRNAEPLILQGHMDMVCEKNSNTTHDFLTQGIRPLVRDGWVCADGTTLGADNGVALALALAVASAPMPDRLPLELLFTVDEETGLTGALRLDPALLQGRRLVNLYSEDDKVFIIGCAGGIDLTIRFPATPRPGPTPGTVCALSGFRGGHSGVNIHEGRGNAILAVAGLLRELANEVPGLELLELSGGNKKNAIPREARFVVAGDQREALHRVSTRLLPEWRKVEAGAALSISTETIATPRRLPAGVLPFLASIPQGVRSMDPNFPDIVRCSASLGVARITEDGLELQAHGRSPVTSERLELSRNFETLAKANGGVFLSQGDYPGWAPTPGSVLRSRAEKLFSATFGKAPVVCAIHAGLEAGIIGDKLGTSELIAYGPTVLDAHAPTERLEIASFERAYSFLYALVQPDGEGK